MVFLPDFSVVDKNWLVYQPALSVVDKNSWYINRFCRSWTILGGIFHGCVLLGQYWFITYNIGRYTNQYYPRQTKHGDKPTITVHERQNRLIYQLILSKQDTSVKYTTQYCPRPTKPVDIPTIFVHNRQNRLIYQPIFVHDRKNWEKYQPLLSITDKTG